MKPSKTAYATKKKPAKRGDGDNPMIDKLLQLKCRIDDYKKTLDEVEDSNSDKDYVQGQINKLRGGGNLYKLHMEECNKIWRKYA